MNQQEVSKIMVMVESMYKDCFKVNDQKLLFNMWCEMLAEHEWGFVVNNFKEHIRTSKFPPKISDLITDKRKLAIEGPYIPNAEETRRNMMLIEQERRLALSTSTETLTKEQLDDLKKETLRKLTESSKRNRENRDIYGGIL